MTEKKITRLLDQASEAKDNGDFDDAKRLTLQAIVGISTEQEHFLTGLGQTATAQQLADWFGQCSFVFNAV